MMLKSGSNRNRAPNALENSQHILYKYQDFANYTINFPEECPNFNESPLLTRRQRSYTPAYRPSSNTLKYDGIRRSAVKQK